MSPSGLGRSAPSPRCPCRSPRSGRRLTRPAAGREALASPCSPRTCRGCRPRSRHCRPAGLTRLHRRRASSPPLLPSRAARAPCGSFRWSPSPGPMVPIRVEPGRKRSVAVRGRSRTTAGRAHSGVETGTPHTSGQAPCPCREFPAKRASCPRYIPSRQPPSGPHGICQTIHAVMNVTGEQRAFTTRSQAAPRQEPA